MNGHSFTPNNWAYLYFQRPDRSTGSLAVATGSTGAFAVGLGYSAAHGTGSEFVAAYDFGTQKWTTFSLISVISGVPTQTRAYNLWERSALPMPVFSTLMYQARSMTWEYSANITKLKQPKEGDGSKYYGPPKNRMAYYFSVLESLVESARPGRTPKPD